MKYYTILKTKQSLTGTFVTFSKSVNNLIVSVVNVIVIFYSFIASMLTGNGFPHIKPSSVLFLGKP
jgi:hypothetical protein